MNELFESRTCASKLHQFDNFSVQSPITTMSVQLKGLSSMSFVRPVAAVPAASSAFEEDPVVQFAMSLAGDLITIPDMQKAHKDKKAEVDRREVAIKEKRDRMDSINTDLNSAAVSSKDKKILEEEKKVLAVDILDLQSQQGKDFEVLQDLAMNLKKRLDGSCLQRLARMVQQPETASGTSPTSGVRRKERDLFMVRELLRIPEKIEDTSVAAAGLVPECLGNTCIDTAPNLAFGIPQALRSLLLTETGSKIFKEGGLNVSPDGARADCMFTLVAAVVLGKSRSLRFVIGDEVKLGDYSAILHALFVKAQVPKADIWAVVVLEKDQRQGHWRVVVKLQDLLQRMMTSEEETLPSPLGFVSQDEFISCVTEASQTFKESFTKARDNNGQTFDPKDWISNGEELRNTRKRLMTEVDSNDNNSNSNNNNNSSSSSSSSNNNNNLDIFLERLSATLEHSVKTAVKTAFAEEKPTRRGK